MNDPKTNKKLLLQIILLILAVLMVPYLTIPVLTAWWFYKKSKFSHVAKVIVSWIFGGLILALIGYCSIAYAKDVEPQLNILEPEQKISIVSPQVTIKGTYDPVDRRVWINGKEISASNGSFETTYQLKEGENIIEVTAGDWKRARVSLVVTRELTDEEKAARATPTPTPKPTSIPTQEPSKAPVVQKQATSTPTPIPTTNPQISNTPISTETISQKNAVKKAKSYLSYSAFSHDGLIAQLEYEKFSHTDAVYGADNSGANWNEQAAKKAKQYMEYSAFSRGSLIEQLKFEKFSQEQSEYGANAVGF